MNGSSYRGMSVHELTNPSYAAHYLGESLLHGELALLLGAGVSRGSGLPSWQTLVEGCEDELGLNRPGGERTSEKLMSAMDKVRSEFLSPGRSEVNFRELVRRNLYPDTYLDGESYPDDLLQNMMLIAVGALIMPSSRGSVREVLTLNFDDLLEWYLGIHGFTTQPITELPQVVSSDADVTIFHPHGYIPLTKSGIPTDWMILTRQQFIKRIAGTDGRAWARFLTNLFATKRLLAVGTSMSDIDLDVHLEAAGEGRVDDEPMGFVVNSEFDEEEAEQLKLRNLVPVAVGSRDAIPHFLLEVCRNASAGSR